MTRLMDMLERHEGRRDRPYRCTAGKLTIGVGRNLDDRGLSDDEIDYLLANDVKECIRDLGRFPYWITLDDVRRDALVSMRFNLGAGGFRRFVGMNSALAAGDYGKAADCMMDSIWARQVGGRAVELANMMRTGRYEDDVQG